MKEADDMTLICNDSPVKRVSVKTFIFPVSKSCISEFWYDELIISMLHFVFLKGQRDDVSIDELKEYC